MRRTRQWRRMIPGCIIILWGPDLCSSNQYNTGWSGADPDGPGAGAGIAEFGSSGKHELPGNQLRAGRVVAGSVGIVNGLLRKDQRAGHVVVAASGNIVRP